MAEPSRLSIDPRALGLFRILLGILVLADLGLRVQDFGIHYTEAGWLPLARLADLPDPRWPWSLHTVSAAPAWTASLFAIHAAAAACFTLGWRTRAANALTWVLTVSLQARNPPVLDAADAFMALALFWCLFLPAGLACSLDSRRSPAGGPGPATPALLTGAAAAAPLVQLALVFFCAGLHKLADPVWRSGEAVRFAMHIDQLVLGPGRLLREHETLMRLGTWATIGLELLAPVLLLAEARPGRLRILGLALVAGLEVSFLLTIRLMLFPFLGLATLVLFLPPAWLAGWAVPGGRDPEGPGRGDRVVGVLLGYVLLWNLSGLPGSPLPRRPLAPLAFFLRLDQTWSLFTPPLADDGWWVAVGVTPDGRELDLATGAPARFESPGDTWAMFPSHRTWAYMRYLSFEGTEALRAAYLKARLREGRASGTGLVALRLYYVVERTTGTGVEPPRPYLVHEEVRTTGVLRVR